MERITKTERMDGKGRRGPRIIAVGGGKGGVGKSLVSAGIATALAMSGKQTVCLDLDLGGANLHTFFGLKNTETGIGDFIYRPKSRNLADYCTECGVENLKLISGNGFIPGIANLYYFQKMKVIRAIKRLEFDYVVMDLGAGTSYNVVDFFSLTRSGIVVLNPEPTSILNGYEFIKNVLFRIFSRSFKKGSVAHDVIETHKYGGEDGTGSTVSLLLEEMERHDPEGAATLRQICQDFCPGIVMNMTASQRQAEQLVGNLRGICRQFLSIDVCYIGMIPNDPAVTTSLVKLRNLLVHRPDSPASKAVAALAAKCQEGHFVSSSDLQFDIAEEGAETESPAGSDLDNLLERFFHVFSQDYGGDGDQALRWAVGGNGNGQQKTKGGDDRESKAISPGAFLHLQPRNDPSWFRPRFFTDRRYHGEDVVIPDRPSGAISLIVALSDWEESLDHADSATRQELAAAWFDCGCLFVRGGQTASAIRAFSRVLALEPEDRQALSNLAGCNILAGNYNKAVTLLEDAATAPGADAVMIFNLGLGHFLLGDHKMAAGLLSRLVDHPDAWAAVPGLLAESLYHAGRHEDALKALDLCTTVMQDARGEDPMHLLVAYNRGLVLMALGRFEEAAGQFRAVLKANPQDGESLSALGLCHIHLGEADQAEACLSRAVSLRPADLGLRAARASLLFSRRHLDRAIEDAEAIAKLRPDNPGYRQLLEAIRAAI